MNAAERPSYQAPPFVQTALELDLAIDCDKPAIAGTAVLTFVNRGRQPLREVPLLLNRLMTIREIRDGAGRKLAVRSAITIFEDEPLRQVVFARVTCPRPIPAGQVGDAGGCLRRRTRLCDASVAPVLRRTPFAQYGRADLTNYSYPVGMLMFAALEAVVGSEKLDAGVRAHVQGRMASGGTTDQMVASIADSVGAWRPRWPRQAPGTSVAAPCASRC